jgi:hypothetical protein
MLRSNNSPPSSRMNAPAGGPYLSFLSQSAFFFRRALRTHPPRYQAGQQNLRNAAGFPGLATEFFLSGHAFRGCGKTHVLYQGFAFCSTRDGCRALKALVAPSQAGSRLSMLRSNNSPPSSPMNAPAGRAYRSFLSQSAFFFPRVLRTHPPRYQAGQQNLRSAASFPVLAAECFVSGHDFSLRKNSCFVSGTTSVGPYTIESKLGFSPWAVGFRPGADFSRILLSCAAWTCAHEG